MKKLLSIIVPSLVTIMFFFFIGCNHSDSSDDFPPMDMDHLLKSSQYQEFSNEINAFSRKITQSLLSLSSEDQKRMNEICAALPKSKDREQSYALMEELLKVVGIDYLNDTKRISELSEKLFKNQKFTLEEYMKAVR